MPYSESYFIPMEVRQIRYGGGTFDPRSGLIRLFGIIQRKKVVLLDSNPELCGDLLASSDTKGSFIETLFATPAWHPIYSIESMDGKLWEQLSQDFKKLLSRIHWRERLTEITRKEMCRLSESSEIEVVGAEAIARLTVRIFFELLFKKEIALNDETLFYQASLEWRKEIAIKGRADPKIKLAFWNRLTSLLENSEFKDGLETYAKDPSSWISLFAQPFILSPQINLSDIFVSVFHYLRKDPYLLQQAKIWAKNGNRPHLDGILLESIRLKHPFPILERELKADFKGHGHEFSKGTQIFILLDKFKQDETFQPERWLKSNHENPYSALPFASGPRMCVGKPIAMELMSEMLKAFLLDFPDEKIQPAVGHLYSGRDNDEATSLRETLYQLSIFLRRLFQSFSVSSECPMKKIKSRLSL